MRKTVIGYDEFRTLYDSKRIIHFHFGGYPYTLDDIEAYRKEAKIVEDTLLKRFAENELYKDTAEATTVNVLRAFRNSYRDGDGPNAGQYDLEYQKAERDLSEADYAYRQIAAPLSTDTRWISVSEDAETEVEYHVLWEPGKFFASSRIKFAPEKFTL